MKTTIKTDLKENNVKITMAQCSFLGQTTTVLWPSNTGINKPWASFILFTNLYLFRFSEKWYMIQLPKRFHCIILHNPERGNFACSIDKQSICAGTIFPGNIGPRDICPTLLTTEITDLIWKGQICPFSPPKFENLWVWTFVLSKICFFFYSKIFFIEYSLT